MVPPEPWQERLKEEDPRYIGAALYGLAYIVKRAAPSLCMGDSADIHTDVSLGEAGDRWKSTLYIYDAVEGGVGYGEKVYERFEDAVVLCRTIIGECECTAGCPACVPTLPPGVEDEEVTGLMIESNAAVACTRSLIDMLLTGRVTVPEVRMFDRTLEAAVNPPPEDRERIVLRRKLDRASRMLKKKRDRLH